MSRRRAYKEPPKPFDAAFVGIDKMEACVAYRTVTRDFTVDDVVDWLWPPSVIDKLRIAAPLVRESSYRGTFMDDLHVDDTHVVKMMLTIPEGMLMPKEGLFAPHFTPWEPSIRGCLKDTVEVIDKFNTVRRVVHWLNKWATPGAARYYFPNLGALLPADHAFNQTDGQRYREPVQPISTIMGDMREATAIIAMGLLSYDPEHANGCHNFRIRMLLQEGGFSQDIWLA